MSIMAALMTVLLLVVRIIPGKWFPKYMAYFLWGIVGIRLCLPVALQSKASLIHFLAERFIKSVPLPNTAIDLPQTSFTNVIQSVTDYYPLDYKNEVLEKFFELSGVVWMIGAGVCLMVFILFYSVTSIQLNKGTRMKTPDCLDPIKKQLKVYKTIPVYQHQAITSPLVFGVLKPRIIIPYNMASMNLELILFHELVHIKRYDNLWKLLSIFVVCIHWFNPFAWLFLYFSGRDMELACDEKVLNTIEVEKKKEYAQTLTMLATRQNYPLSAFGNTAVKIRIMGIVTHKKLALWMVLLATLFCATVAVMLLTNP